MKYRLQIFTVQKQKHLSLEEIGSDDPLIIWKKLLDLMIEAELLEKKDTKNVEKDPQVAHDFLTNGILQVGISFVIRKKVYYLYHCEDNLTLHTVSFSCDHLDEELCEVATRYTEDIINENNSGSEKSDDESSSEEKKVECLVIGEKGVGKTTFIERFSDKPYNFREIGAEEEIPKGPEYAIILFGSEKESQKNFYDLYKSVRKHFGNKKIFVIGNQEDRYSDSENERKRLEKIEDFLYDEKVKMTYLSKKRKGTPSELGDFLKKVFG